MKTACLTALCLNVASGANAQFISIEDLTSCKIIEDSLARLTCYDKLAGSIAVSDTQDESKPEENVEMVEVTDQNDDSPLATAWTLVKATDEISGNNVSRAYLDADSQRGGNSAPEFLMLACDCDGGASIFMGTTGYLGNMRGQTNVEYRWGESDPVSETLGGIDKW